MVHSWKQKHKIWLVLDNSAIADEGTFISVESGASVNTADAAGARSSGTEAMFPV